MALNLGSETGSLINHMLSRQTLGQPEPAVGAGATLLAWSDRYAATVIRVEAGIVSVQEDRAIRVDPNGMSDAQTYRHEPDPQGAVHHFRLGGGGWEQVERGRTGRWRRREGLGLLLGRRDHHHDFSF